MALDDTWPLLALNVLNSFLSLGSWPSGPDSLITFLRWNFRQSPGERTSAPEDFVVVFVRTVFSTSLKRVTYFVIPSRYQHPIYFQQP